MAAGPFYFSLLNSVASDRHGEFEVMFQYGVELQTIEMDLDHIRIRLLEQYWNVADSWEEPGTPDELRIKKFIIVLAFEDMCYRLYAYREKVFQLVNATLLLKHDQGNPRLRAGVLADLTRLGERTIVSRLGQLDADPMMKGSWNVEINLRTDSRSIS